MSDNSQENDPTHFLKHILQMGINGAPGIAGAKELGERYLTNPDFDSKMDRINALVKMEGRKNFTSGFLTSLGGIATLPVSIPASLGLNWILQTRMVAAMAHVGGFDIDDPPVRMSIALCLLGKRGKDLLNQNFESFEAYFKQRGLNSIPTKTLSIINQTIATRLMSIAAQKGMTRVSKAIPLVGGVVGGYLDFQSCKESADFAKELFQFHLSAELPDHHQNFD